MACTHDHSCEDHDCSSNWSLFKHIDLSKVLALNEAVPGSVKSVFKAWEHRLNSSEVDLLDYYNLGSNLPGSWLALMCPCSTGGLLFRVIGSCPSNNLLSLPLLYDVGYLESNDGDPELLVFIPFTSDVKIKSISIVGGADGTSPSKMRVFINREGIDFSDAQSMQAVQEWDLAENMQGMLEYQTRYSKFQSVGNITLHFPANFGGETSQIHYIGFKGEATQLKRDVVATIVYELMPNPSDHKTKAENGGGFSRVE